MRIGAVDIFCGIGGLTYGVQRAGINVVAGFDIDSRCEYGFVTNNNSRFINKNVSEVKGQEIIDLLSEYDIKVLVGCAPCQPFSSHRKDKKNRKTHKDWNLLSEYSRIIEEAVPHIVSMENVPQLQQEAVFGDFYNTLKRMGYNIKHKIVDVSDFGVAQRRKRLVLLASRIGNIDFIEPTHNESKVKIKDIIGFLPQVKPGEQCAIDKLHISSKLSEINTIRIIHSKPNGTWRDWPDEIKLTCHKKKEGESYPSVYGRMDWDDLAPTITTQFICYGTGRFGHPEQNRALTLREGALLQSFPKDYKFVAEDGIVVLKSIARQIGNAVPPRIGEVIGMSILKSISTSYKEITNE